MDLFLSLAQKMSIVATLAYFMSGLKPFRKLLVQPANSGFKALMVIVFGLFGILGTYTGISINGAIANNRIIGVAVAGLLGGPWVGLGAGLVAGGHRFLLGGFTAFSCGLSTAVEGLICGIIYYLNKRQPVDWKKAFLVGVATESLQMLIILLLARPFDEALQLVKVIALPMISVNSAGIAIFMAIIHNVLGELQRKEAAQAKLVLDIADQTLPHLRRGLNLETARTTADIIYRQTGVGAVAITDLEKVLAFTGAGDDHHRPGLPVLTNLTQEVLQTGRIFVTQTSEGIGCNNDRCPLSSAVVVPLYQDNSIIGTLKLYQSAGRRVTPVETELASGLAKLFSTQLELAHLEYRARLAARAEIKALQAQVNPHFLFNALNTIVYFVRRDPEMARTLIARLGDYFRKNLEISGDFVELGRELEHIRSYLAIEEARFKQKLCVNIDVDPVCLKGSVPPLILQPLVENALKHGLMPKKGGGRLSITALREGEQIIINIADDGVGMTEEKLERLLAGKKCSEAGMGIGFHNVNERLACIYGENYRPRVDSSPGGGTRVTVCIPYLEAV
ncbi:MAG: LytS/YhcK type 5TM receptor domain-containing protein [Bacillota bacterium]